MNYNLDEFEGTTDFIYINPFLTIISTNPLGVGFYLNTINKHKSFKGNEKKRFNLDAFSESGGDFYSQPDDCLDRWIARIYAEKGIPVAVDSNPESLIGKTITDLYLEHFQSLPNNSYSGENLMRKPEHYFVVLKPSGIYNVIDILDERKAGLEERCEKFGIDYQIGEFSVLFVFKQLVEFLPYLFIRNASTFCCIIIGKIPKMYQQGQDLIIRIK